MPALYRLSFAALLYCLITVALTYPLVLRLWSVFPHDPGDPALNTWILWWNARAIPLTSTWWNAPAFFPVPGSLSFSENLLGLSLVATPIQWLGGSPLLAYNVVFLLTFPLCAIGAYLLALEITKRHDAAFIAGLLFGFAPYRMSHLPHIQVLAAFGMPFALLALHRYLRDPRPRWLVLFGAAWFLQALCNGYYLLFFSVLIGIWMLWFSPPTTKPGAFRAIVVALFVAAVPLLPLLWRYRAFHQQFGFVRDFGTTRHYGADVLSLFSSEPALMIWGRLQFYTRAEGQLFPGLTVTVLAIASLWILRQDFSVMEKDDAAERKWRTVRRVLKVLCLIAGLVALAAWLGGPWQISAFGTSLLSIGNPVKPLTGAIAMGMLLLVTGARVRRAYTTQSVLGFYVIASFVMWLLSLGPAPTLMGEPLMYRGPYAMLMSLPGFTALRVPARFWMMAVLCLSVVCAIVFHRLGSSFPKWRPILVAVMVLGALSDAWIWKFPVVTVPRVWRTNACIPPDSTGAVMELPLGTVVPDVGAMYRSISHRHPTINGYSGNFPPHYPALRYALSAREPFVLDVLATHGLEYVVIDRGHRSEHAFRRYIEAQKGAQLVCVESAHAVYRLERTAAPPASKPPSVLRVASLFANVNEGTVNLMLDGDVTTRWTTGPQKEGMMLEINLGAVREVEAIELSLGPSPADFARGLRIEASEDQVAWREVWQGRSAGRAVKGALRDPSAIPVEYDLSSVHAQYLRLWLTDSDDFFYWTIGELKVLGP